MSKSDKVEILNEIIADTFNFEDNSIGLRNWGLFIAEDVDFINNDQEGFPGIKVISWRPDFVTFDIDGETISMEFSCGGWGVCLNEAMAL